MKLVDEWSSVENHAVKGPGDQPQEVLCKGRHAQQGPCTIARPCLGNKPVARVHNLLTLNHKTTFETYCCLYFDCSQRWPWQGPHLVDMAGLQKVRPYQLQLFFSNKYAYAQIWKVSADKHTVAAAASSIEKGLQEGLESTSDKGACARSVHGMARHAIVLSLKRTFAHS